MNMTAGSVNPQSSYHRLYLSMCWIFTINVERGDVSWYGLARGGWVFLLVQVRIFSRHLIQIFMGGGVDASLIHVDTTASVSSIPPVGLMVSS